MTQIETAPYYEQAAVWPKQGRHILAQFDGDTIVVYQAYSQEIGRYAVEHQRFGGGFGYSRMSWIKPNFLWMMYRSGWGTKENQHVTLAVRLRRTFFDLLLENAVPSTWDRILHGSEGEWRKAVAQSEVRLQWDPDHHPHGNPLERRAIQLGLRGETLRTYGTAQIISIEDVSSFVAAQRRNLNEHGISALETPVERVYRPATSETAERLGLSSA